MNHIDFTTYKIWFNNLPNYIKNYYWEKCVREMGTNYNNYLIHLMYLNR